MTKVKVILPSGEAREAQLDFRYSFSRLCKWICDDIGINPDSHRLVLIPNIDSNLSTIKEDVTVRLEPIITWVKSELSMTVGDLKECIEILGEVDKPFCTEHNLDYSKGNKLYQKLLKIMKEAE